VKFYVDQRKVAMDDGKFKAQYGMTIYSDQGRVLYSSAYYDDLSENKFENALRAIDWAVKKFKVLLQNKVLPEEKVLFIIGSKTIYSWFENEVAPEPYTILFSDILFELSFIPCPFEVILSQSGGKRVVYRDSSDDKPLKATDLLEAFKNQ